MSDTSSRIRNAYNEWAGVYDTNDNATRDLNARALREEDLDLKGKSVLEIGCGTGLNTEYLIRQGGRVWGMDFSKGMLDKARRRLEGEKIHFVSADIKERWPFSDRSFDMMIAGLVLEHIRDLSHVFREAGRVVKPGGRFYLAELHPYRQLRQSQAKYVSSETGKEVLVDAFLHMTSEYVNKALDAGFSLLRMRERKGQNDDIPRLLTLLFELNAVPKRKL